MPPSVNSPELMEVEQPYYILCSKAVATFIMLQET